MLHNNNKRSNKNEKKTHIIHAKKRCKCATATNKCCVVSKCPDNNNQTRASLQDADNICAHDSNKI